LENLTVNFAVNLSFLLSSVTATSVEHATLVGRHHILDVDEGVFASICLERFKCLLDKITQVQLLPLRVVDPISHVFVLLLVKVHDWKNLPVVGHQGLTDGVRALDEGLENFQCNLNDLGITRV